MGRPRDLRPVRGGRSHLRDRLGAPARAGLRQHDAGRLGDPHRVLRRHGDRRRRRRADRRPVRSPLRLYGLIELVLVGDRPRHAADVQADRRALQRDLPDPRVQPSGARAGAARAGAPGPGAGHCADGCHAADPHPSPDPRRAPQPRLRAALRREHDRRNPGDAGRGPRAHRAARPDRGPRGRGDVLGIAGLAAVLLARRQGELADGRRSPGAALRQPQDARLEPRPAGASDRIHLGHDVAWLPGHVDPPACVGHRQHDLRVHDDPRGLPDRDRPRGHHLQPGPVADRRPTAVPGRGTADGRRARVRVAAVAARQPEHLRPEPAARHHRRAASGR